MPHPTTEVGQSLVMKSEEACTLQWDHGLLQSLDKEGRKKRKLWIWWFWGKCELATSLWVSSSEVINHSDLTGSALKLKEATSARGISRWSSYGKDLAPRLSARARTSLCFFPFRALSPILAWNLFRGGEDVPSPDPCIKTHYWKIPGVRGGLKKKKSIKSTNPKSEYLCSPRDGYVLGTTLPAIHQENKIQLRPVSLITAY